MGTYFKIAPLFFYLEQENLPEDFSESKKYPLILILNLCDQILTFKIIENGRRIQ